MVASISIFKPALYTIAQPQIVVVEKDRRYRVIGDVFTDDFDIRESVLQYT